MAHITPAVKGGGVSDCQGETEPVGDKGIFCFLLRTQDFCLQPLIWVGFSGEKGVHIGFAWGKVGVGSIVGKVEQWQLGDLLSTSYCSDYFSSEAQASLNNATKNTTTKLRKRQISFPGGYSLFYSASQPLLRKWQQSPSLQVWTVSGESVTGFVVGPYSPLCQNLVFPPTGGLIEKNIKR